MYYIYNFSWTTDLQTTVNQSTVFIHIEYVCKDTVFCSCSTAKSRWRRWLVVSSVCTCAGGVLTIRRFLFPKQKHVVATLLPMLRAEPEVRSFVGSYLVPGTPLIHKHTWISWTKNVKKVHVRRKSIFNVRSTMDIYTRKGH